MPIPQSFPFTRYLAAKKSVDDRALNTHVWSAFVNSFNDYAKSKPCRILEIGSGIGTMLDRLIPLLDAHPDVDYFAVDAAPDNTSLAADRLAAHDYGPRRCTRRAGVTDPAAPRYDLTIAAPSSASAATLRLHLHTADFFDFAARPDLPPFNLILAHAFIDLVDVPRALATIRRIAAPGATLYLTINFDGVTLFEPELDPAFDALVERLYHATMDARITNGVPSGDSRTGRHLYHHLLRAGFIPRAVGPSDWMVTPHYVDAHQAQPTYPDDEAFFLHFIIHTVHGALAGHPQLPADRFAAWIAARHQQVERGELVYIAHQLDYLATLPE